MRKTLEILNNRTFGSLELAEKAVQQLKDMYAGNQADKVATFVDELVTTYPLMAVFLKMKEMLEDNHFENLAKFEDLISDKNYIKSYESIFNEKKNIMCFSNSNAVFELLKHYKEKVNRVYSPKSNPGEEGVVYAQKIRQLGLECLSINDLTISRYIPHVDFVLIGCDLITEDFFINKMGTLQLVLLAEYFHKKVYCVYPKIKEVRIDSFSFTDKLFFEKIPTKYIEKMKENNNGKSKNF